MNKICAIIAAFAVLIAPLTYAADEPKPDLQKIKLRVTGMFSAERQDDLREAGKQLTEVTLESIDYDAGEATFSYDALKKFKNQKPEQIEKQIDNMLRQASHQTFGAKALCAIPKDKLERVEIPILGLDCKSCCYAAYRIIAQIDGVEDARTSFKDGKAIALINPEKTNRAALVEAFRKREVRVNEPEPPKPEKK